MAENGATDAQLMSHHDWRSVKMVQEYVENTKSHRVKLAELSTGISLKKPTATSTVTSTTAGSTTSLDGGDMTGGRFVQHQSENRQSPINNSTNALETSSLDGDDGTGGRFVQHQSKNHQSPTTISTTGSNDMDHVRGKLLKIF